MIAQLRPPSLAQIDALAQATIERLPPLFRNHLRGVVLRVDDFPDDEVMRVMNLDSPFDILGLYSGRSVALQGDVPSGVLPDTIHLYRRPILDAWADSTDSIEDWVTHVLIHEVGHHFGLSDDDIAAIEAESD